MNETIYYCDACGKRITEKRANNNYSFFYKAVQGNRYESKRNELCATCQKKFDKFLIDFFKEAPVEWTKEN